MRREQAVVGVCGIVALAIGCARQASSPGPRFDAVRLSRGAGIRSYIFESVERNPAGAGRLRVSVTLVTAPDGSETARLTNVERSKNVASEPAPVAIDSTCRRLAGADGGEFARISITPPAPIDRLLPVCMPEDLFGAATDLLAIFMIQQQPRFRARELTGPGASLPFPGYEATWTRPPAVIMARITSDSGRITVESVDANLARIHWNSSPMTVRILRDITPGTRALLYGTEWFAIRLDVDRRSGELQRATTTVDSLSLAMFSPFSGDRIPDVPPAGRGFPVTIQRSLSLVRVADGPLSPPSHRPSRTR